MANHRFHLIPQCRYNIIKDRIKNKITTKKTRYSFDIYSIDKNLYYTHQLPMEDLYPQAVLVASGTRLDLVLDNDRLCFVDCHAAASKRNIPLTTVM
jgi:hypothetical protein